MIKTVKELKNLNWRIKKRRSTTLTEPAANLPLTLGESEKEEKISDINLPLREAAELCSLLQPKGTQGRLVKGIH